MEPSLAMRAKSSWRRAGVWWRWRQSRGCCRQVVLALAALVLVVLASGGCGGGGGGILIKPSARADASGILIFPMPGHNLFWLRA